MPQTARRAQKQGGRFYWGAPSLMSVLVVLTVLIVAACDTTHESDLTGSVPEGPSALSTELDDVRFPDPLVAPELIVSGGPPPDGIPAIDQPAFTDVASADVWLEGEEPLVVVEVEDVVRGYPVQILMWHEIVNDTLADIPISITYCPLCNSATTWVRRVRGIETTFGTSGRVYSTALVMYDRATESLWTHFDGVAVAGVLTGDRLSPIPSPLLAWADFKEVYPDAEILDRARTGYSNPYGLNPYVGYDNPDRDFWAGALDPDTRAMAMERVVGVTINEMSRAYLQADLRNASPSLLQDELGGRPILIVWTEGQASALEAATISGGRDVGSTGVFIAEVDGEPTMFRVEDDLILDQETNSTWDVSGKAVSGPLSGRTLERIPHLDTFWYAWATYAPGTELADVS